MQQLDKNSYTCLSDYVRIRSTLNDLLFTAQSTLNQVHTFSDHCDKYSRTAVSVPAPPPWGALMPSMPSLYTHSLFRFPRSLVSDTASERSALLDVTSRRRRE